MKFKELFEHKKVESVPEAPKEEPQKIGGINKSVTAATFGVFATMIPNISNAEVSVPAKDKMPDGVHSPMPVKNDVDSEPFDFMSKEGKEIREKHFNNVEFAKEAKEHVGKGGYISEEEPGCVLIAENTGPASGGSFANKYAIQVKVFKISVEPVDGYKITRISFDDENLNEKSDIKVSSRMNSVAINSFGIYDAYWRLRENMSPEDINSLFAKANPGLNVDLLIAALEHEKSNINSDQTKVSEINKDIAMLKQTPQAPQGERPQFAEVNEEN